MRIFLSHPRSGTGSLLIITTRKDSSIVSGSLVMSIFTLVVFCRLAHGWLFPNCPSSDHLLTRAFPYLYISLDRYISNPTALVEEFYTFLDRIARRTVRHSDLHNSDFSTLLPPFLFYVIANSGSRRSTVNRALIVLSKSAKASPLRKSSALARESA